MDNIRIFGRGQVHVEYGPLNMNIVAECLGVPLTEAAISGAEEAIRLLNTIAQFKEIAKFNISLLSVRESYPEVLNRMIEACKMTGDSSLTPMAAVAGAISDLVAESIESMGATKVVVENGGDIAIKLHKGEIAKVGVARRRWMGHEYIIEVKPGSGIGGIATSGFGGRGFTKGIADAAVAISPSGALADACSTVIGNAVITDNAKVTKRPAEELYPDTDIRGHLVTVKVESLDSKTAEEAIHNGLKRTEELRKIGAAIGAVIIVGDRVGMTPRGIAMKAENSQLAKHAEF